MAVRIASRMVAVVAATFVVVLAALLGYSRGLSAAQSAYPRVIAPTILTGSDIGFRLMSPGSPEGVLVVRIDGNWVPAESARGPRLLK